MATIVRVHHHVTLEHVAPDDILPALPRDGEVIQEGGFTDDRICISRQCFLLVDRRDPRHFREDFDSLRLRLFDGGSPIRRNGFTYAVSHESIAQSLEEISQVLQRTLSDDRNSGLRSMLFCVVSLHVISLPEEMDVGNDEHDEEEARVVEESVESASWFAEGPVSREAVASLGRTRIDGGDCAICLEELLPGSEHASMPCGHVFHECCIVEWLGLSPSCPLCRFLL